MDRLWIRLSLVFTLVIGIALSAIGITVRLTFASLLDPDRIPPPEVIAYFEEIGAGPMPIDVTTVAVLVGLIAIVAGVCMSRSLTKPLSELEEGAEAIGGQDLSYRVPIQGSKEMVAVATAFNDMAAQLEQEETLRRNLLADVSHELRHPVHILRGNLQAILDDVYPLEKEEIKRLLDQTQHLTVLVNDLQVLAQAEANQLPLEKQDVDIAALVKQAANSFAAQSAARNIEIRIELLGTMPKAIYVDAARIRQGVHNLLDNAINHSRNDSQILVTVQQFPQTLQIKIRDFGEGISAEHLPYVFDRFYQTDRARNRGEAGTGLGLAIVKAMIEAHNGRIEAASAGPGQGSLFTITLPLKNPAGKQHELIK
jgi:two-component system, OmpR family, sensor kinase